MTPLPSAVLRAISTWEALRLPHQAYRPLNKERREVRIVELYPKSFRDRTERQYVSCYTQLVALGAAASHFSEPYVALSYTWGDAAKRVPIYLDNCVAHVTENLSLALQHFEQEDLALRIWIDSICINQNDEAEKNHQVGMMAEIFTRASMVLVWLGPGGGGAEEGVETLRKMGTEAVQMYRHLQQMPMPRDPDNPVRGRNAEDRVLELMEPRWFPDGVPCFDPRSTQEVLERPWFRRVWVLQEAAVNANVAFHCGRQTISKHMLWAGVRTAKLLANKISNRSRAGGCDADDPSILQAVAGVGFLSRRTLHLVTTRKRKLPLWALLCDITMNLGEWAYEATDPRDRVFAVLGFSSDADVLNIRPDYAKTCATIYTEVAEAILAHSGTLDILYAVSRPRNVKAMPSWVPDWSVPIPSTFGPRSIGRFTAAGPMSRSRAAFRSDQFHNRLLILSGYRVDTVEAVVPYQVDPRWEDDSDNEGLMSLFTDSLRGLGSQEQTAYPSEEARYDALWRTPIADCDAVIDTKLEMRPAASEWMKKSFEAFVGTAHGADPGSRRRVSKPYIHTMKLEAARRRIFVSSRGYFGLGQETVRVGDTICVLLGGDSPFLIREAGRGYHELVGEAYVHGIMHGEFLVKNLAVEQFTIC
ncbi:heterokaryon incompatibility protein-domain-containing protein [Dactylonectria macrodidyma]|uniref:Heterokaryon incompatibility protein-domain-containing protein n=1 Tax=Dactylonectria macrodidyma TaxID=307937 RepID=A0A9P9D0Z9_9HYPO|nr:heterokaryon incompatibility protein-domain-containing protein [Dactylonectria macrodidyma]